MWVSNKLNSASQFSKWVRTVIPWLHWARLDRRVSGCRNSLQKRLDSFWLNSNVSGTQQLSTTHLANWKRCNTCAPAHSCAPPTQAVDGPKWCDRNHSAQPSTQFLVILDTLYKKNTTRIQPSICLWLKISNDYNTRVYPSIDGISKSPKQSPPYMDVLW